jgi:hypothetical protein
MNVQENEIRELAIAELDQISGGFGPLLALTFGGRFYEAAVDAMITMMAVTDSCHEAEEQEARVDPEVNPPGKLFRQESDKRAQAQLARENSDEPAHGREEQALDENLFHHRHTRRAEFREVCVVRPSFRFSRIHPRRDP